MNKCLIVALVVVLASVAHADDLSSINQANCGRRNVFKGLDLNDKIVGGQQAKQGDWGWQVALLNNGRLSCGGSLINRQWVLTAAHCVYGNRNPLVYSIIVGSTDRVTLQPSAQKRTVSKVILHPQYNSNQIKNDVALLKLTTPVDYSNEVVAVCVDDGKTNYEGANTWATGFGSLYSGGTTVSKLYEVQMKILTATRGKAKYPTSNQAVEVCAGDNENKDTCQGDSGGPLVVVNPTNGKWYNTGVTSWGYGCGQGGVYARTSAFFDWIKTNVKAN